MSDPSTTMPAAAVSLTYDDALPVHREGVAPALTARGLRGTFYVPAAAGDLHAHRAEWQRIAADGHELGNHTCFHPCRGKGTEPSWIDPVYDLRWYSEKRFADEVALADAVLRGMDGRTERSFAATCGNLSVGDGPTERSVTEVALRHALCIRSGIAPRGVARGTLPPVLCALHGDGRTAAEVIPAIDAAIAAGEWLIILFHGVGQGTHGLFIAPDEHLRIIDHLAVRADQVRVAPVVDVWREWNR